MHSKTIPLHGYLIYLMEQREVWFKLWSFAPPILWPPWQSAISVSHWTQWKPETCAYLFKIVNNNTVTATTTATTNKHKQNWVPYIQSLWNFSDGMSWRSDTEPEILRQFSWKTPRYRDLKLGVAVCWSQRKTMMTVTDDQHTRSLGWKFHPPLHSLGEPSHCQFCSPGKVSC